MNIKTTWRFRIETKEYQRSVWFYKGYYLDHTKQHSHNKQSMITPKALAGLWNLFKCIEHSTKYILPRIQVFVSFAIKKGTKESIRVHTMCTFVLNFKAHLQSTDFNFDRLFLSIHSPINSFLFFYKNTQSWVQNFSGIDVYAVIVLDHI